MPPKKNLTKKSFLKLKKTLIFLASKVKNH